MPSETGTAALLERCDGNCSSRCDELAALAATVRAALELLVRAAGDGRPTTVTAGVLDEPRPGERAGAAAALMRREGTLWRLGFAGRTVHVPATKGMLDLAVLLARPGREVPALDLAAAAGPARADGRAPSTTGSGLHPAGDLGERVDATARRAYAGRIRELQAELDEADAAADAGRSTRAQQELDLLTRELSGAYGLHGPRRSGDPAEKARSAVTLRIRAAIAKIRSAHPALGVHLEDRIRTGRLCSYCGDTVTWHVVR